MRERVRGIGEGVMIVFHRSITFLSWSLWTLSNGTRRTTTSQCSIEHNRKSRGMAAHFATLLKLSL